MRSFNVNDETLVANVSRAWQANEKSVKVPFTLFTSGVRGIVASDAAAHIRIDVTMTERASGAIRGESGLDVAIRETRETVISVASETARRVQEAADTQNEAFLACQAADQMMTDAEGEAEGFLFWRLRSAIRSVRDALQDHGDAGVPITGVVAKDLLSLEAFAPAAPVLDTELLRAPSTDPRPATVSAVTQAASGFVREASAGASVWRSLTPADIGMVTSDRTVKHLLSTAAELREQAAEISGSDPERAGRILSEIAGIETEAMTRAMSQITGTKADRLETEVSVLKSRSQR